MGVGVVARETPVLLLIVLLELAERRHCTVLLSRGRYAVAVCLRVRTLGVGLPI